MCEINFHKLYNKRYFRPKNTMKEREVKICRGSFNKKLIKHTERYNVSQ